MTAKQFFKSNAFKCIITLLCILLICGVFLTVMNGWLKVTDEEKLQRAISKIYGENVATERIKDSDIENYNDKATIDEAYRVKDNGDYLIKATGKGGFDNGTVTCWVVIKVSNGAISGIGKVVIDSNKGQSYIDRVGSNALNQFGQFYEEGIIYTPSLITGATVTFTKNAICNAVNGAIDYVNGKWLGNAATAGSKLLGVLAKIYGETEISVYGANGLITAEDETVTGLISSPVTEGKATVNEIYKVTFTDTDENEVTQYVISSTGTGGFENGTVTCMTAVTVEADNKLTIYSVTITEHTSQSYIDDGKITHLDNYKGVVYDGSFEFNPSGDYVSSGATKSSTAINNAVNGALKYLLGSDILAGGDANE